VRPIRIGENSVGLREDEQLHIAARYQGVIPINVQERSIGAEVRRLTDNWGADIVFECSGAHSAWKTIADLPRPGGCIVIVGLPVDPVTLDVAVLSSREIRIESVFRYAHQYERAIALMASGRVDLKPLISETFPFERSIEAFDRAVAGKPTDLKLQIRLD